MNRIAASKFRLAGGERAGEDGVRLHLGLSDYKAYIGCNLNSNLADQLEALGRRQGDANRFLAQPLGVSAVVETKDGYVLLMRRSKRVGEAANMIGIPGGNPEPSDCGISMTRIVVMGAPARGTRRRRSSAGVLPASAGSKAATDHGPEDNAKFAGLIRQQLFDSVLHEISTEINLPPERLDAPLLLGVTRNMRAYGRPYANFLGTFDFVMP